MNHLAPVAFLLAQAAPGGAFGQYAGLIFNVAIIFAIWYFLVIRPQQKQRKSHEAALMGLQKGQQIVTAGGLIAEVIHIKDGMKDGQSVKSLADRVTIRSGESKVVVERGRIAKVLAPDGGDSSAA